MKLLSTLTLLLLVSFRLTAAPATAPVGPAASEKTAKKLTCCQEARAKDKECPHSCCIAAHRRGESCVKCNPGKEDLKKDDKLAGKKAKPELAKPAAPAPKEAQKTDSAPKKAGSS